MPCGKVTVLFHVARINMKTYLGLRKGAGWASRRFLCSRQGKRVRVVDRIGGVDALNQFLDPDASANVTVASNDGQSGDVDILAQMQKR
jgi:hypothetical protein